MASLVLRDHLVIQKAIRLTERQQAFLDKEELPVELGEQLWRKYVTVPASTGLARVSRMVLDVVQRSYHEMTRGQENRKSGQSKRNVLAENYRTPTQQQANASGFLRRGAD